MTLTEQLRLISEGTDPRTGEAGLLDELRQDPYARYYAARLAYDLGVSKTKPRSVNYLHRPVDSIFRRLCEWRLNEAAVQNLPAYCIFKDDELMEIASGDVIRKEDLKHICGINKKRYELYADAIYDILHDFMES